MTSNPAPLCLVDDGFIVLSPQKKPKSQSSQYALQQQQITLLLANGDAVPIPEHCAMHAQLFRSMMATNFRESRTRVVDLSAHDIDSVRVVIDFLKLEYENNGPWRDNSAAPRVVFHFPLDFDSVFDVFQAAAYFGLTELRKLCVLLYRHNIDQVDSDAITQLPTDVVTEIAAGFDELELLMFEHSLMPAAADGLWLGKCRDVLGASAPSAANDARRAVLERALNAAIAARGDGRPREQLELASGVVQSHCVPLLRVRPSLRAHLQLGFANLVSLDISCDFAAGVVDMAPLANDAVAAIVEHAQRRGGALRRVAARHCGVSKTVLQALLQYERWETLDVSHNALDERDFELLLAYVRANATIKKLAVGGVKFMRSITALVNMFRNANRLESLDLSFAEVQSRAFDVVGPLDAVAADGCLRELSLDNTYVFGGATESIFANLPAALRSLSMRRCSVSVASHSLSHLLQHLPNLERIDLSDDFLHHPTLHQMGQSATLTADAMRQICDVLLFPALSHIVLPGQCSATRAFVDAVGRLAHPVTFAVSSEAALQQFSMALEQFPLARVVLASADRAKA